MVMRVVCTDCVFSLQIHVSEIFVQAACFLMKQLKRAVGYVHFEHILLSLYPEETGCNHRNVT